MGDLAGAEVEGEAGSVARRQRVGQRRRAERESEVPLRKCGNNTDQGAAATQRFLMRVTQVG